jgi:SAM-dependent methyltransferase
VTNAALTDAAGQWDARYDTPDYIFGAAPSRFLERELMRFRARSRVLCVADGEGRNSVFLARHGLDVHAVDISPVGIAKARRLADGAGVGVEFEIADLAHWAWPKAAYDAVAAIFIQFAGPQLRAHVFAQMKAALKPGGLLLLHGYRPEQIALGTGGPPCAENMYDEALLRAAFSDFQIEMLTSYEASLAEGRGHHGRSALIDLIARKPESTP